MRKTTLTTVLLTTAIFFSACSGSAQANCPDGFTCIPNTATPTLPGSMPLETATSTSTPRPETTPMLESLAAFGVKIRYPIQIANWKLYEYDYYKAGWATDNPNCRIREDGVLESNGVDSCTVFPFPGLRVAAIVNDINRFMLGQVLGAYGAEEESVIPNPADNGEYIVTWIFK